MSDRTMSVEAALVALARVTSGMTDDEAQACVAEVVDIEEMLAVVATEVEG